MVNVGHQSNGRVGDPSHHISLQSIDGSNETGFMCVSEDGSVLPNVGVKPFPNRASQIREGRAKHADRVPPFQDVSIADMSGGMGMLHHDDDESRYLEGHQIDTSLPGHAMLTGRPTYTKGIRDFNEYVPAKTVEMSWRTVYGTGGANADTEISFVPTATYNASTVIIPMRKVGSPTGTLTVTLRDAGDSVMDTATVDVTTLPLHSPYEVVFDLDDNDEVAISTTFKINVNYEGGTATNYIQLWYDATNSKFPYRVLDDTSNFSFIPIEYRGGFYIITQPEDRSVSKLYLLGYRGLADSNSADKGKLNDSDNNWTVDELIGFPARIVAGPGSEEEQTWRTITDNTAGVSDVSPDWNIDHTADTEYYIQTDTWQLIETYDFYCTDAKVIDKTLVLAAGSTDYVRRMRWGNDDQTWTEETSSDETFKASKFCAIPHTNTHGRRKTYDLYTARNNNYDGDKNSPNTITRFTTAPFWGTPYLETVRITDHRAWTADEIEYVDQSSDKLWARFDIGDSFVTGVIGEKQFNPVVDLSSSEQIALAVSTNVNIAAEQLELIILDSADNEISLYFPPISAEDDMNDDFKWVVIDLHDDDTVPSHEFIDLSRIKRLRVGLKADLGAMTIKFGKSGLWGLTRPDGQGQYVFEFGERVNNMQEYGGGSGQVLRKPWVGTTRNVYYIEGDHLLPIYLTEITEFEDERNCEMMGVNSGNLFFNVGKKVQRYYAGQLDNLGPEVDYPLPNNRAGYPCTFASYPGRSVVGWDCESTGYSWVGFRRAHGWHESYRSPLRGARIRKIHSFARMDTTDQLFVSEGADIMYLPVSSDAEQDTNYEYNYHGHVQSSRVYGSLRETEKYFHSYEIIQERHTQGSTSDLEVGLRVYYRTNNHSDWTLIDDYTTIPNQEEKIGSNNISGNWIQFLVEFETKKAKYSPIYVSGVLDMIERTKVKNQFAYNIVLTSMNDETLDGSDEGVLGSTKKTQLDTWVNQPLPLKLRSNSIFEDNKIVALEPSAVRQVSHEVDGELEIRIFKLALLEVDDG